jgi:hypothetical protein
MPVVRLYDHVGTALVLEWPSGIRYSNQTMGTTCFQPSIEGVLVPIGNDVAMDTNALLSAENALYDYFVREHRGTGAVRGISEHDADVIDGVLAKNFAFAGVRVDRSRLTDSHEAWIHVTIDHVEQPVALFEGFGDGPWRGVLTWTNSD